MIMRRRSRNNNGGRREVRRRSLSSREGVSVSYGALLGVCALCMTCASPARGGATCVPAALRRGDAGEREGAARLASCVACHGAGRGRERDGGCQCVVHGRGMSELKTSTYASLDLDFIVFFYY